MPRQGWMYLSITHLSFYSYLLGKETKILLRWTDVTALDKINSFLFPDSIRVSTRDSQVRNREKYYIRMLCFIHVSYIFNFSALLFHVFAQIGDF